MQQIEFTECIHGERSGNFDHYVGSKSTKTKRTTTKDFYGRVVETTTHYQGVRIIGKMVRDHFGYRYFLRK